MSLLSLSLAGTVATGAVLLLDAAFAHRISIRTRRFWWLAVLFAFCLAPVSLPILPPATLAALASAATVPREEATISLGEALGFPALPPVGEAFSGLAILWATGAALVLLGLWGATFRTTLRWRRERLCTDARLLSLLEDCRVVAAVHVPIALVVSSRIASPALLGWLRPRLLLPEPLTREASDDQLRAIILHELAHCAAHDIPERWPFFLLCAIHWFNPAAYLATWRWMQLQEEAADERAIRWLSESVPDCEPRALYLDTLLAALKAGRAASSNPRPFGALSLIENSIKKRIMTIQRSLHTRPRPMLALAITALLLAGVTIRPTRGAQTPTTEEADAADPAKTEAVAAMEAWLALIDAGDYGKSWDESSAFFKAHVTRDFWIESLKGVRTPLGKLKQRTLASALHQRNVPRPDGTMAKVDAVIALFDTAFGNLASSRETVTFDREKDGSWRVSGYYIKPM